MQHEVMGKTNHEVCDKDLFKTGNSADFSYLKYTIGTLCTVIIKQQRIQTHGALPDNLALQTHY